MKKVELTQHEFNQATRPSIRKLKTAYKRKPKYKEKYKDGDYDD